MTESQITGKLIKKLRAMMPDAVVFKHSDLYNAGVPDFSVTIYGVTTWFEAKKHPNKLTKIQASFIIRLQPRAYVLTYSPDAKRIHIGSFEMSDTFDTAVEEIIRICQTK